jgi:hypothetical protein
MGEDEWRFAEQSASLGPLYRNAVEATPYVVASYFNADEPAAMNRYYPFIGKPWEVYPKEVSMREFNFYYLADAVHNPERKTVWTGVYLDPAGQGWMLSCISPVYYGDTLKGVVGLDLTRRRPEPQRARWHLLFAGGPRWPNLGGHGAGTPIDRPA